jgi:hypothetical protein
VLLELLVGAEFLDRGIAPGPGQRDLHWLLKQVEAVGLLRSLLSRIGVVIDNESLAFCLQIGLGDYFDDISKFREDLAERILERVYLDALLEIPHVNAGARLKC